jgi:hypothetical protein
VYRLRAAVSIAVLAVNRTEHGQWQGGEWHGLDGDGSSLVTVLALNLIGDALNDTLNPTLRDQ